MEIAALKHVSDSIYSFPLSDNEIEIRLLTKKDDDIKKVELVYNEKYKFHEGVKYKRINKKCDDGVYDYYIIRIKLKDKRFAYVFKLTLENNEEYYFSESGVSKEYDFTKGYYDFFQISYINELDTIKINKKLQNRVFYQIFVDRFYKDKNNNNPRINIKWGDKVDSKSIAGGTLKGIEEKLDYLSSLGINAIYLTPIFSADSNHKYDTIDYYKVSRDFGDESNLHSLIKAIHEKGMIVLLDGVYNHVSRLCPFFVDVIKNGAKSKYFNWFFIKGDKVFEEKMNYETFASCYYLPRLNLNNLEVQQYILDVGKYYVKDYQIDGYRLDVSDEIPHAFWTKFKAELKTIKNDIILLGENWHNAHAFLNSGLEFDSIMNYAFTKEVLNYVAYNNTNALDFKNRLISNLFRYKGNVNYNLLNLISSHDVNRFLDECNNDVDKFLIGYAILFTYIGVPCIYYGDEIGTDGGYDPYNRACFNWNESEWNYKIFNTIKKLIQIHKDESINELEININAKDDILYLSRFNKTKNITLIINLSNFDKKLNISNEILFQNNYSNNILHNKGFVLTKEDSNYEKY